MASTRDARIRVGKRGYHPYNTRIDERLRARRCQAMMGARLQTDIGCGTARIAFRQCDRFGMGPPAGLCPATRQDPTVAHQHTTHCRVGPYTPKPARAQADGLAHEVIVALRDQGLLWLFMLWSQFRNELVKIIRLLEILVNAGKSYICDRIDPREGFHDNLADHF